MGLGYVVAMTVPSIEIIAEAAEGYAGDYEKESALVDAAAAAGVDAIKFHLIHAEEFCTDDYEHVEQVHEVAKRLADDGRRDLDR